MSIYRCTITGIYLLQRCQNVLHVQEAGGSSIDELGIATSLRDHWVEQVRFLQNIGYQYQTITVQKKFPSSGTPIVLDISAKSGTNTGAGYHPSIALLWTLRSDLATRHGRGRIYVGGVHGQTPLNGLVHPTVLNNMTTVAGIMMGLYASGTGSSPIEWVVGTHTYGGSGSWNGVKTMVARPYFGIQRRRNIGVGA